MVRLLQGVEAMPAHAMNSASQPTVAVEQLETAGTDLDTVKAHLRILQNMNASEELLTLAESVSARLLEARRAIESGDTNRANTILDSASTLNSSAQRKVDQLARRLRRLRDIRRRLRAIKRR